MAGETPEQVVERIEAIPAEERTKRQSSALNRARSAILYAERERGGERGEKTGLIASTSHAGAGAHAIPPCPDPFAPDGMKQLLGVWFRRLWESGHDRTLTQMDISNGFGAARLAAGVGKDAPTPTQYRLPMDSLLGASESDAPSEEATQASVDSDVASEHSDDEDDDSSNGERKS